MKFGEFLNKILIQVVSPTKHLSLISMLGLLAGCAGPNTPFGPIWNLADSSEVPHSRKNTEANTINPFGDDRKNQEDIQIQFYPKRQILHAKTPLQISISDHYGNLDESKLWIKYNGLNVSTAFLLNSSKKNDHQKRTVDFYFPSTYFSPDQTHSVEFTYVKSNGNTYSKKWEPPICHSTEMDSVLNTSFFSPPSWILEMIIKHSIENSINPSMVAALVAQESSFVSRTISWSKAMGLTQVTPIAETEILQQFSHWPSFPNLNQFNIPQIKALIALNKVNRYNEWRLNPELSLIGGIKYLKILEQRWDKINGKSLISRHFKNESEWETKLILASYNSGFSRVYQSLQRFGKNWMESPELNEARKYVNRIISYCDHFSEI